MKIVPLHPFDRGRFACVDDEDFEYVMRFKWFYLQSLTYNLGGYAYTNLKFRDGAKFTAGMHRILLGDREPYDGWAQEYHVQKYLMPNGTYLLKGTVRSGGNKRLTVDHINGDGLNNTRANLRFATSSEQMRNRCRCRRQFGSYYRECTCRGVKDPE
jgi:hypothetical protein